MQARLTTPRKSPLPLRRLSCPRDTRPAADPADSACPAAAAHSHIPAADIPAEARTVHTVLEGVHIAAAGAEVRRSSLRSREAQVRRCYNRVAAGDKDSLQCGLEAAIAGMREAHDPGQVSMCVVKGRGG